METFFYHITPIAFLAMGTISILIQLQGGVTRDAAYRVCIIAFLLSILIDINLIEHRTRYPQQKTSCEKAQVIYEDTLP